VVIEGGRAKKLDQVPPSGANEIMREERNCPRNRRAAHSTVDRSHDDELLVVVLLLSRGEEARRVSVTFGQVECSSLGAGDSNCDAKEERFQRKLFQVRGTTRFHFNCPVHSISSYSTVRSRRYGIPSSFDECRGDARACWRRRSFDCKNPCAAVNERPGRVREARRQRRVARQCESATAISVSDDEEEATTKSNECPKWAKRALKDWSGVAREGRLTDANKNTDEKVCLEPCRIELWFCEERAGSGRQIERV